MKIKTFLNEEILTEQIIAERFVKEIEQYVIEAELTPDQINNIFAAAEKGQTDAGRNRTLAGKGKDVAATGVDAVKDAAKFIDNKINELGKLVQSAGPVKNADAKFDELKAKFSKSDGKVVAAVKVVSDWAKENPTKASIAVGILTTAGAMLGGPLGGAIAGFLARATKDLLQGEKLSTAAGKSIKTGVYGFLAGKAFNFLSGELKDWFSEMKADDAKAAGDALKSVTATDALAKAQEQYGDAAEVYQRAFPSGVVKHDISDVIMVQGQYAHYDVGELYLTNDQYETFRNLRDNIDVPAILDGGVDADGFPLPGSANPEYFAKIGKAYEYLQNIADNTDQAEIARVASAGQEAMAAIKNAGTDAINSPEIQAQLAKISGDAASDVAIMNSIADTAAAAGQGAVAGKMSANDDKQKSQESVLPKGKKLSEGQIYLLFNKLTAVNNQWLAEGIIFESVFDAVRRQQLDEGPMDALKKAGAAVKGAAGALASKGTEKLRTAGKNLTTKVTTDKLQSAWKKAGSPTDSNAVAAILAQAGVNAEVVNTVYKDMGIEAPKTSDQGATDDTTATTSADATTDNTEKETPADATGATSNATDGDSEQDSTTSKEQVDLKALAALIKQLGVEKQVKQLLQVA